MLASHRLAWDTFTHSCWCSPKAVEANAAQSSAHVHLLGTTCCCKSEDFKLVLISTTCETGILRSNQPDTNEYHQALLEFIHPIPNRMDTGNDRIGRHLVDAVNAMHAPPRNSQALLHIATCLRFGTTRPIAQQWLTSPRTSPINTAQLEHRQQRRSPPPISPSEWLARRMSRYLQSRGCHRRQAFTRSGPSALW
jgi:hypothetical protein